MWIWSSWSSGGISPTATALPSTSMRCSSQTKRGSRKSRSWWRTSTTVRTTRSRKSCWKHCHAKTFTPSMWRNLQIVLSQTTSLKGCWEGCSMRWRCVPTTLRVGATGHQLWMTSYRRPPRLKKVRLPGCWRRRRTRSGLAFLSRTTTGTASRKQRCAGSESLGQWSGTLPWAARLQCPRQLPARRTKRAMSRWMCQIRSSAPSPRSTEGVGRPCSPALHLALSTRFRWPASTAMAMGLTQLACAWCAALAYQTCLAGYDMRSLQLKLEWRSLNNFSG
mmetsp:Transcript_50914/g.121788  ORF Transcript_50914/g.121788 Transcript_50914/m.121788 type:complete len:278 (+) Transcript_50914:4213-5046(+)